MSLTSANIDPTTAPWTDAAGDPHCALNFVVREAPKE
jgi:hypothetical protein